MPEPELRGALGALVEREDVPEPGLCCECAAPALAELPRACLLGNAISAEGLGDESNNVACGPKLR